jgi:uncharacterized protein with HEPN domain
MMEALDTAIGFAQGRARADLDDDRMLLLALVQAMSVVGEAASNVSRETQATMPDVPWPLIIGMRNRLVHAYFEIDRDILWTTVTERAPELTERLRRALEQHPPQ